MSRVFSIQATFLGYVSLVEQKVGVRSHPQKSFWCEAVNLRNFQEILTLPRTNIVPENRPSQKEIYLPTINFQGLCSISGV